jgi:hypothetical protein
MQILPLFLACKPKAPVKAALCKVVLDTEQHPAQPLTELFGDFLYAYQTAGKYAPVWLSCDTKEMCLHPRNIPAHRSVKQI